MSKSKNISMLLLFVFVSTSNAFCGLMPIDTIKAKSFIHSFQTLLKDNNPEAAIPYIRPNYRKDILAAFPELEIFGTKMDSSVIIDFEFSANWLKANVRHYYKNYPPLDNSLFAVNDEGNYYITLPFDAHSNKWCKIETKHFIFHYNPKKDKSTIVYGLVFPNKYGINYVEKEYSKLVEKLNIQIPKKINVYCANSLDEIKELSGFPNISGQSVTFDYFYTIINIFPHSIFHEVMHVFEYQLLLNSGCSNPWQGRNTFLQEGLAKHFDGDGGLWKRYTCLSWLKKRITSGENITLFSVLADSSMKDYPAITALTEYLIETYGENKLKTLYVKTEDNSQFCKMVKDLYNVDSTELNKNWIGWINNTSADTSKQYITSTFKLITSEWKKISHPGIDIYYERIASVPDKNQVDFFKKQYELYCQRKNITKYDKITFYLAGSTNRLKEIVDPGKFWFKDSLMADTTFINSKIFLE